MPSGVTERKKFPFAYGSMNACNATSASSRRNGARRLFGPYSNGFSCPALPMKLPIAEMSGLKAFDAAGLKTLLTVWTSVRAGGAGALVTAVDPVAWAVAAGCGSAGGWTTDRKSTRQNSSHVAL